MTVLSEEIPQRSESPAAGGVDLLEARKRRQREAVDRYQRKKKLELEQRRTVTPEQLEALRRDPRLLKGVCRNCGQLLKDVGPHLGRCPVGPMTWVEYKVKWGFRPDENATRSEEKEQSYKRPETAAAVARAMERGRAIHMERYRAARREWDVIVLRVNGRSLLDIASELKFATRKPVRTAVRSVDLPEGKQYQCDRAKPFTRGSGVDLYKALGQSRPDFARLVSTETHQVRERRIVIWFTKRDSNMEPAEARASIELRDRIAKTLLGQEGRGRDSYDRREVLAALFPRYREEYKTLGRTLRAIGAFLEENSAAAEPEISSFVLDQAQLDTVCFRELIRWMAERKPRGASLPELMTVIMNRRDAIRGTKNPHRVAVDILADTMGAPAKIVLDAIQEQIKPASPEKMRYILRSFPEFAQPKAAERPKGKSGRKKLKPEKRRPFQMAQAVYAAENDMNRGLTLLKDSRKKNPPNEAIHRKILAEAGFNALQIEALLPSSKAIGAAQRYVALIFRDAKHPQGIRLKTVQDACARYPKG